MHESLMHTPAAAHPPHPQESSAPLGQSGKRRAPWAHWARRVLAHQRSWRHLVPAALLTVLVVLVYRQTLSFSFIDLDDRLHIVDNAFVNEPSWPALAKLWHSIYSGMFIPVVYSAWILVAALSQLVTGKPGQAGLDPQFFHGFNVLLHACNTVLVYYLVRTLLHHADLQTASDTPTETTSSAAATSAHRSKKISWSALVAATLFAVHPLQVEAVAWVSGAKDLLAAFFALLASLCYFGLGTASPSAAAATMKSGMPRAPKKVGHPHGRRHKRRHPGPHQRLTAPSHPPGGKAPRPHTRRRRAALLYGLATLFFALGLLSKPSLAVLPAALLGLEIFYLKYPWQPAVRRLLLWGVLAITVYGVTRAAQPAADVPFITPILWRPLIALDALGFYLSKIFWPLRLTYDYGRTPQQVISSGLLNFTWLLPVALTALLWASRRRAGSAAVAAGWLFGVVCLTPVLGLTPFVFQEFSTVADRYTYLALVGVCLGLAGLLNRCRSRRQGLSCAPLVVGVVVWLAVRSAATQVPTWRDTEALNLHAIAVNPTGFFAYSNLGGTYIRQGRSQEAFTYLTQAVQHNREYKIPQFNLGNVLLLQGKLQEAETHFLQLIADEAIAPTSQVMWHSDLYFVLARTQEALGKPDAALRSAERATQINWTHIPAHLKCATLLLRQGLRAASERHLAVVRQLAPNTPELAPIEAMLRQSP